MKMKSGPGAANRGVRAFTIAELLVGIIIVAVCTGIVVFAIASGNRHDKP